MQTRKALIQSHCNALNGRYVEGGFSKGPYMVFEHHCFEIVFDYHVVSTGKSTITYTRVRTAFKNPKEYKLKLGKEGFFSKVGKAFGGQDIEIGDEIFDQSHIIKSNDESMTTRLLNKFEIKSRINFKKNFSLDIVQKNSMGIKSVEGESGLIFYTVGKLKHEVEVITLIELFRHILDYMVELNITSEVKPMSVLYKEKKG